MVKSLRTVTLVEVGGGVREEGEEGKGKIVTLVIERAVQ